MTFGLEWGWGADVTVATAILDRYLELGGNFIDTANIYTHGHSEKIIGDHIGRHPARRDRVVLATKFSASMFSGDPNAGGGGRKAMLNALEHSLRRLQTDYIDLYWLHCEDLHTPIEETLRALDDAVRAGKIRYIGLSDVSAWKAARAATLAQWRGYEPVIALQLEYSLLERTIEGEHVPAALELGLGITPWSPLKGGILSGKYTRANRGQNKEGRNAAREDQFPESTYVLIDELERIAVVHDTTPAAVALAWVCSRPGITSPIIGARTLEQFEANVKALDCMLTDEERQSLTDLTAPALNFPYQFVRNTGAFRHGGTTINGVSYPTWPLAPTDSSRY
jgi:aryl-alcohol dehydrogenase-like predicted oxidoreductase